MKGGRYKMKDHLLGDRLREARNNKGMTLEEVAKILNSGHSYISQLETGVRTPSLKMLQQLCDLYEVSPNYILGYEKEILEQQPAHIKKIIDEFGVPNIEKVYQFSKEKNLPIDWLIHMVETLGNEVAKIKK